MGSESSRQLEYFDPNTRENQRNLNELLHFVHELVKEEGEDEDLVVLRRGAARAMGLCLAAVEHISTSIGARYQVLPRPSEVKEADA